MSYGENMQMHVSRRAVSSDLWPLLFFTTKASPISSTDHGGGKRRRVVILSCLLTTIPKQRRADFQFGNFSAPRSLRQRPHKSSAILQDWKML
jgi:hypothetical protein